MRTSKLVTCPTLAVLLAILLGLSGCSSKKSSDSEKDANLESAATDAVPAVEASPAPDASATPVASAEAAPPTETPKPKHRHKRHAAPPAELPAEPQQVVDTHLIPDSVPSPLAELAPSPTPTQIQPPPPVQAQVTPSPVPTAQPTVTADAGSGEGFMEKLKSYRLALGGLVLGGVGIAFIRGAIKKRGGGDQFG